MEGDGAEDGDWKPKDDTDIENTGADDVADEEFVFVATSGGDCGAEVREGGAEGDDGKGDNAVGNVDGGGDGVGGINDEITTKDDAGDAEKNKEERFTD